jgi:hypothetical protein
MSTIPQQAVATPLSDSSASASARRRAATRRRLDIASDGDHRGFVVDFAGALAAQYPVVRRMVGDDSFRAAVHRFVANHPPTRSQDDETFPRFLRRLGCDASFEYLADIAELELALAKARYAPPVHLVAARAVAWSTERLDGLRLTLHPSVGLIASRFPIVTIWEANRSDESDGMIARWKAEAALVAQALLDVRVWRLPADGGHAFASAVQDGCTIAEAAAAAADGWPDFDLAANLAMLDEASVIVGVARAA